MTKADKWIFVCLLTASVVCILLLNVFLEMGREKCVIIECGGREYARYEMSQEKNINTIEIKTEFGYNKLEIYSDYVKMTDSDCKDKSCVHQKPVFSGGMIVCLPNKCVVRIESEGSVDGFAY